MKSFVALAVLVLLVVVALGADFGTPTGGSNDTGDRGIFYVDNYGAAHDGVTDDGPAIQAANDAAEASSGIVQFGPGVYAFDNSLVIDQSVTWRGVGRSDIGAWGNGTVLYHIGTANGKTAIRIGFDGDNTRELDGITLENFTIRADKSGASNKTGNCVHITGVTSMLMLNVDIYHHSASDTGKAALLLQATHEHGSVTGFKFIGGHIFSPRNPGKEGYGIVIDSAVDSTGNPGNEVEWFITDCQFTSFKMNNSKKGFESILCKISGDPDSTNNANHKFVSGYLDFGDSSGFRTEQEGDRTRFIAVNFDAEPDTVGVVLSNTTQGVSFIACRMETNMRDLQANNELRARVWDTGGAGTRAMPISNPSFILEPYASGESPDTTSLGRGNGQMWIVNNAAGPDTLMFWVDGTRRGIPIP